MLGDRYEAAIKAASHAMSRHWRDMHTNEALGLQRMLAAHALAAVLPDLLADAWDEGHADGLHNAHEYREHRKVRNPYRPENTAGSVSRYNVSGQLTAEHAEAHPDTTVSEARDHQPEPIVRTVGDLTARHIGKRVRIGGGRALRLDGLTHTGRGDVKLDISDAQKSGWLVCERDTPCEVLP